MRAKALTTMTALALLAACLPPRALAQNTLPDLGGAGDTALSPQTERRIGESIMRDIRRDPSYIDDPEVAEYLGGVGARLTQETAGARHDFEFFALRDPAINAFALPGGFVGVHSGLLVATDTESELASVLGHEIAHVTQRHIARMIGQQQQMQIPVLAAIAAAILLGRTRPDLAAGATAAVQAGAVSSQLAFSRDYEREADRVGLQALAGAGFDPSAMAAFFDKMQRVARISDDGTMPGYLRTHPLTGDRIADAQNRAASLPYKQHLDTPEFQLVRAKLRADVGDARDAMTHFESALRDGRYASEAAARYGLANAELRARRAREADDEVARLRKSGAAGPMIETLAARVKQALGDSEGAAALLAQARARYPYSRPILYAHVAALLDAGRNQDAAGQLVEAVRNYPHDPRLLVLQSKTYAALGNRLLQHQAQAEVYVLQGSLPAAIEQLTLARAAGDGDFYQLSVIDARLKDLRSQHTEETRDNKR
ncbi:MAG TPA: M48 family metalloprotease [Burkholderiales bacterium]|nr:M48 family metalloprotease [Burkholderiales bacterium]